VFRICSSHSSRKPNILTLNIISHLLSDDVLFLYAGETNKVGDKVLVARGGDGGMASNQYVGQKGDALSVTLDLKLISDIGFVGCVLCS